jgi:hypothetical protein
MLELSGEGYSIARDVLHVFGVEQVSNEHGKRQLAKGERSQRLFFREEKVEVEDLEEKERRKQVVWWISVCFERRPDNQQQRVNEHQHYIL